MFTHVHTNITIKKQSNHLECTKRGATKGYSVRAKTLCDPQYLQDELKKIEEVIVENGGTQRGIRNATKDGTP